MTPLRAAGWLLTTGGLLALAGAFTPPYKQWYAPLPEALRTIAAHPVAWRFINGAFLVGTIVAAMGFAALAVALRGRSAGTATLLAAIAFSIGTLFWVLELIFRLTVQAWAADQLVATGSIPDTFAPLRAQVRLYFSLFAPFAFGGLAVAGWSVLTAALAPRWIAWTMVTVGVAGAPVVVFIGPWMLYVPIVMLGVSLALS